MIAGLGHMFANAARGWTGFWFTPADPTTLGVIRICTGLLVFYVHFAYCFDLQDLFGKDAWYSLAAADRRRKEEPHRKPRSDWGPPTELVLPHEPEPRGQVLDYLRNFPDDPAESRRLLSLLKLPRLPEFVRDLPTDEAERQRMLALLKLTEVPPDPSLPLNADYWGRHPPPNIVLALRTPVAAFLESLPDDPAERTQILDYMAMWRVDPRRVTTGNTVWSIWFHVTNPDWMRVVHGLVLVTIFLFTIGLGTRVTSVLTWLAALSYVHRSPDTLFGSDDVMMVLLFYLMIGPSGAALSVDRLLAHWQAVRRARREGQPPPEWLPPEPLVSANFALRLMQVHFCIIYFAAGTSKLLGGRWWNGQALYYSIADYELGLLEHPFYSHLLSELCRTRWLWEIVFTTGTWFTLALEILLPILVWNRRWRVPLVLGVVALHTAIALAMGIAVFSLFMAALVLAFIPGEAVQGLVSRRLSRAPQLSEKLLVSQELT
jgi:hypothetical protein